jgi:restriction endonuclease
MAQFLGGWAFFLATWFLLYLCAFAVFVASYPNIPGGWTWSNPRAVLVFFLAMAVPGYVPGFALAIPIHLAVSGIAKAITNAYKRSHPSVHLEEYRRALRWHELYLAAKGQAEAAARAAAHEAELRKRSYWTFLDGYAFERATAEVLNKHQFNAIVTPGSADGGVDIQVRRNGLRGVVQCKAHMACVGPHVVRDLYCVIHHSRADFGVIVSLGGFTRGAVEFARDKPILFVDLDDLIAMQEGRDVLAAAFSGSASATGS